MPFKSMDFTGNIGEQIILEFFDENFSKILCFPNPKTKNNAQVADILLWLNRFVFLIEVKTFVSSSYQINDWASDRIKEGVEQLEKNYDRIVSNQEIFLNNRYYHTKLDCKGLSDIYGLIILVHDDECTLKPSDSCKSIYESKLPIHVFSWNKLQFLTQEIDTIPDFKYYLQDRIKFVRNSDIPLNKELDAIGLYKMGLNSFPESIITFENSKSWNTYLSSMDQERKNRELDNLDSEWLDSFESLFTENRKIFNDIPLGLHFTWVFAVISRRERAIMGKKFKNAQKYFLEGRQSRYFAFNIPASGHWIVFYFSKHTDKEQSIILRKMVDQKLIQLIEDENFQYAVFGIGIKVSSLYPPTILGINAALLIGSDVVRGTYSNDDIRLAKTVWGNIRSGEIKEFPSN
jgi:hypothetical protein